MPITPPPVLQYLANFCAVGPKYHGHVLTHLSSFMSGKRSFILKTEEFVFGYSKRSALAFSFHLSKSSTPQNVKHVWVMMYGVLPLFGTRQGFMWWSRDDWAPKLKIPQPKLISPRPWWLGILKQHRWICKVHRLDAGITSSDMMKHDIHKALCFYAVLSIKASVLSIYLLQKLEWAFTNQSLSWSEVL